MLAAAAGVAAWGALHPAAQLFGRTLRRLPAAAQSIALTFDDGPSPRNTPRVLDLLDEYGARATFFLIGRYVREFPELAREIVARGHAVGNHTETHPSLVWASRARILAEFDRCQQAIGEATGVRAAWVRPPYGYRSPLVHRAARQSGFRGVAMWARSAHDWRNATSPQIVNRLLRVRAGDIVLLHDGAPPEEGGPGADRRPTIGALEFWLPRWQEAGIGFVALDETAVPGAVEPRGEVLT